MKLYKTRSGTILQTGGVYTELPFEWDELVNRQGLHGYLEQLQAEHRHTGVRSLGDVLAPIGRQEVWAAGVTYQQSRTARMDESKQSGASVFYDKVYEAERPELFFKAVPQRVSGPGQPIRIRNDSTWDVPEPELTVFICSHGTIEGYAIGNDVSSRSIEGENPLYLPQAKVFDGSAALGACLYVPSRPPDGQTEITMEIIRNGGSVYRGSAALSRMKRSLDELASWLFRELTFPDGCFLMTGTCLVPPDGFTLKLGDLVRISITGMGTLENHVTTR